MSGAFSIAQQKRLDANVPLAALIREDQARTGEVINKGG